MREARLYHGGKWRDGLATHEVRDNCRGDVIGTAHEPSPEQIGEAVGMLHAAHGSNGPI